MINCENIANTHHCTKIARIAKADVHRSPDLVVFRYFIGLNLICPNLARFENLALDNEIWTWQFQGLILNMCDVTDICMKLKFPPKIA